jgi:hypothetical protein
MHWRLIRVLLLILVSFNAFISDFDPVRPKARALVRPIGSVTHLGVFLQNMTFCWKVFRKKNIVDPTDVY